MIRRTPSSPLPWLRKVASGQPEGEGEVSRPVAQSTHLGYGDGVSRARPGNLATRTDEHGNIAPYAPDDEEVLGQLFRASLD